MDNQIAPVSRKELSTALLCILLRVVLFGPLAAFLVPGLSALAAESNVATSGESNLPLITVRQFLEGAPGWGEARRVRVQGTVTHSISDKTFFIQDGDAGTYVFHKPATMLRVGELVEVTGHPSLTTTPTLQRCSIRLLGPGPLPSPQVALAADARAGKYHMMLVRVQGMLNPERLRGGHILVLNPGNGEKAFTADLEALPDLRPFERLRPGSLLEVTGVCTVSRGPDKKPVSFKVFVRSPADISVVRPPSWWTPARTWRGLGLVTFVLALALAWVFTLRLQVRRHTAHIRQLNEQLEQRVQDRTAELTEANKELEAFTYSVSHDLRAPLRHISGFASIVSQHPGAQDPDMQKPLKQVADAAARLGRLMDDLLAFSRMARRPLAMQPVPLGPLVDGINQQLQQENPARAIEWKVASLPEVSGDPSTLQIVWQNLLHNAVKYTRNQPKPVIEVSCEKGDHDWHFTVRDNGAGFDMRYADRLFGIFQRLHHDKDFEGNGIGLANVKRIVHRHGGRIWAEGELNRGAAFHFTLPQSVERLESGPA